MDIRIQNSPGRGRGVFAGRDFAPGDTIEDCPVIVMSPQDAVLLDKTLLYDYYFGWEPDGKGAGIVLGYGMLYNHASTPNAAYQKFPGEGPEENKVRFTALHPIAQGEEIFVRYSFPGATSGKEVWFDAI